MGFNFGAFLAGGAEAIKAEADQERQDVKELFNTSAKLWTEMGITNLQTKRAKRKELQNVANNLSKLSSKGQRFTTDQIGTILSQGQGAKVLQDIQALSDAGIDWNPNEIVTFGKDYKETKKDISDILDDIQGKLKTGTPYSDALIESQPTTLSEKLGLFDSSDYIKKRVETYGNVLGMDLSELQALAFDDREFADVQAGTVKIVDRTKIGGGTRTQFEKDIEGIIANTMGTDFAINDVTGRVKMDKQNQDEYAKLQKKLNEVMSNYDTELNTNTVTKGELQDTIKKSLLPKDKDGDGGDGNGKTSFAQKLDDLTKPPEFKGASEDEQKRIIINNLKTHIANTNPDNITLIQLKGTVILKLTELGLAKNKEEADRLLSEIVVTKKQTENNNNNNPNIITDDKGRPMYDLENLPMG
tara:strand:+ start:2628 stop:3872 length:1245 start_codon:yes stop_codon:yes gene_type:complete